MSFGSILEAIVARFESQITTALSIPTELPGRDFSTPSDGSKWIRLSVFFGDRQAMDFGAPTQRNERRGIMVAQVFTPWNADRTDAESIANSIETAFFRWGDGTVSFGPYTAADPPSSRMIGKSGMYLQTNVEAPFVASEYL